EMNAFWSDKIYRRIEREEAMETKEYKTLINKMSKLCHKAIGEAVKQPGVLDRLVKVVAQDAYNTGVEDTKRELRKFLGVRRYD
ncbi:hypothetical protein ACKI1Z_41100, partial [Streptomyces galilaeus]|uniref:hypothetical protein n=2 Tax=Bacteria TaxID=2 RepID=UPI0038F66ABB